MKVLFLSLALGVASIFVLATPAGAQDTDEDRSVEITFDVGDFDSERGDWAITVVHVTGEMEPDQTFTVELLDDDGVVLWSGADTFTAPTTSISVLPFVAVGDVAGTSISQTLPEVLGEAVERVPAEVLSQGAGGGGGGTLALSMVLAVVLVAIVFRTPLPSASTQRWTK